jgi:hypothetical protein
MWHYICVSLYLNDLKIFVCQNKLKKESLLKITVDSSIKDI